MISCTHATRLKGIRGRAIVVGPDRATNERRSLSLPRSTHPQSRRRQVDEWHEWLKFEEGEKTTIHKTSPSLSLPPSLSVPIDTKSETNTSVCWIGRFSNIKRIHNGFLVAETVPDSDGRHGAGSWHLNSHSRFRDWPFTLRYSLSLRPSPTGTSVIRPFCDVCQMELDNGRSTDYAAKWI